MMISSIIPTQTKITVMAYGLMPGIIPAGIIAKKLF